MTYNITKIALFSTAAFALSVLFIMGLLRGMAIESEANKELWAGRCYQAELREDIEFINTYCRGI